MNEPIFCPSCGEEMEEWDVNLHMCHACGKLKNTAPRVRPSGDAWGCVKINYCPICGRKLSEEES